MPDEELSVLVLSISDLSLVAFTSPPAAIDWVVRRYTKATVP
jgi:hypothetical protein